MSMISRFEAGPVPRRLRHAGRLTSWLTLAGLFGQAVAIVLGQVFVKPVAYANDIIAATATCPLDDQDQLTSEYTWSIATAQLAIARCPARPVSIVRRTWSGVWRRTCTPGTQDLATASAWTSCPPPAACTPQEERLKRRNGRTRLDAWKRRCAGKKATVPPDTDPICAVPMLPLDTIVVHQTEAQQWFGPDELQKQHLERGFDDIGYHYVIARTQQGWRIFEGRTEAIEGAHAGSGLNGGSIGIAVAGDYRAQSNPGQDPSTL